MKRVFWLFLLLLSTSILRVYGQNADKNTIKNMLQGLWKLKSNDSVTLAISGDSALEYNLFNKDMGLYSCKLSNKPCDNEEFVASPTGYYLTIEEDEGSALCAALQLINNKEFRLLLDENRLIIFEKMQ